MLIEFFSIQAIWVFFCVAGRWTRNPGWRLIAFLEGLVCMTVVNIWRGHMVYTTSWFMTYLVGRITVKCDPVGVIRLGSFFVWILTDLLALWYEMVYWGNVACEMAMMSGLIYHQFTKINKDRAGKKKDWQQELIYLSVWAPVWVTLFGLYQWGYTTNLPNLIWFIMFGLLFPREPEITAPRDRTPPPPRRNRESLVGLYETMRWARYGQN